MKIAYLTSRYPAVSHTFIQREISALREKGFQISSFSIRRASTEDILGRKAKEEAANTRWLMPPPAGEFIVALFRTFISRPIRAFKTLGVALFCGHNTCNERLKWLAYFMEAILLAHWLKREGFEHLHCHFGNSGSSTGMLAALLAGIPFSMTCHGSELNEPRKFRLAEKVHRATFVVCVSYHGRARLMLVCPETDWPKLHVVRCGQAIVKHSPVPKPHAIPHILSVGRLSKEKGYPILLEALSVLSEQNVRFRCTIVGDGPLRNRLVNSAKNLPEDALTFTGALPADKVANLYASADVVTLPSLSEGVPVVLMEALARRRPVVATRVGGVAELVVHRYNGLLVSPGNAQKLAAALRYVIEHPEEARKMGLYGARHVRTRFDLDSNIQRLTNLFESTRTTLLSSLNEPTTESIKQWKWIPQNS
jgi:colanic acid/amylovoran biosynthesis glycosyltransferase